MTSIRKLLSSLGCAGAAGRVAAACESGRRPLAADLRRLGIDAKSFTSIGHG